MTCRMFDRGSLRDWSPNPPGTASSLPVSEAAADTGVALSREVLQATRLKPADAEAVVLAARQKVSRQLKGRRLVQTHLTR